MVAKSNDPDWIPLTPQVKTASNRRKKSTDTTRMKGKGAPKLSKAKAGKKQKILKKRRQVRKRMSLDKLIELTKVACDLWKCPCGALDLSWMNAKKERSNTSIKRKDFKSGFAALVIGLQESDKVVVSCHGNTVNLHAGSEMDVPNYTSKLNTCSQLVEDIIFIDKDKDFDIDASTRKIDSDGANTHDQNDCVGTVINNDDLSRIIATTELKENVVAWVPLTPQIQAEVGYLDKESVSPKIESANCEGFESNISLSATPKCGKSESLIDILKNRTREENSDKKPHKRMKMKRHRPKVGPITPCTPKARTPKPAKKVKRKKFDAVDGKATTSKRACKRKLDFGEECRAMGQEELMKSQDMADGSSEKRGPETPKINDLILIHEQLPATPTQVQEKEMDNTSSYYGSIEENVLMIQGDKDVRDALADFVVKKMQLLRIDDDSKSCSALVAGEQKKYKPPVNQKYKPPVDLDQATMVVWKLLMENDYNEAAEAEALGADHVEYMKRQRELLRNRLYLILNRMHVVQGDRKFSPWKGSIVDSIIGVFLTQNVSDHSSSNAFMDFATKYPPLSLDEQNERIRLLNQQVMVVSDKSVFIPEVDPPTQVKRRKEKGNKKQKLPINWDDLRKQYSHGLSRERTEHNADSVDWEAIRQASATEVAKVIVKRGMYHQLVGRIQSFLNRLVRDQGSIDLEWLRNVPPPKAKDYLLSISGLGLKSTECVRLLALHFPAFPIDVNAGRVFVRIGLVPLKKLPKGVELHELNDYPSLDSIQKYMWSRACDLDHSLLYEIHCHCVTLGKSFCTKDRPNCKECPMRDQCAHYASALASKKPRLQGSQSTSSQEAPMLTNSDGNEAIHHSNSEAIIEFPPSPMAETPSIEQPFPVAEPVPMEPPDIGDMEDFGTLSLIERSKEIHSFMKANDEISKALFAINPNAASFQLPKQKLEYQLRTVHQVCELPDSHPFLATFPNREYGDRCPYLLAIWTEDECSEKATTCDPGKPSLSREVVEYQKRIRGTILIPCFTANRGQFPLNGTYFQINEVFADHESSLRPIDVPRELIWNLRRRVLYCGKSITSICRGMKMVEVAYLFNRGFICIRGFDIKNRARQPMVKRFH